MEVLRFTASAPLEAAAGAKPVRVKILAYSGGFMQVPGFGRTLIDLAGLTLPDSVTLLDGHENALGSVEAYSAVAKAEKSGEARELVTLERQHIEATRQGVRAAQELERLVRRLLPNLEGGL